ncbi:MAG: dihydrodipicolinate synthase family protein [Gemmatimonadetes bacterium]|jgi:4-hydroxy-tetrahydrodipicolinate synthase|nr:dihydrodipicolinate synthase family protein [Gemmatimonadota bacterium]
MTQPSFAGLWPVMLTPFRDDGAIDWPSVDALVDWYLEKGATGLFAVCQSSEMFALSPDERLQLARSVVARAADRVPVVASGTFGGPVAEQADFVRRMADTGVASVVVLTNQFNPPAADEDDFRSPLEELVALTDPVPLGLYECPVPYKRLLSPRLLAWAASTGRFLYHKDTLCDMEPLKAKIDAVRGTDLALFNANTPTALASLQYGAAGISPIAANIYPELFAWLCSHPREAEAPDLQRLLAVMEGIVVMRYPVGAKHAMHRRGLPISLKCRNADIELNADDRELLRYLLETVDQLNEKLAL